MLMKGANNHHRHRHHHHHHSKLADVQFDPMKSQRHLEVKLVKYITNEALKRSTLLIVVILINCYVRNEEIQRSTDVNGSHS